MGLLKTFDNLNTFSVFLFIQPRILLDLALIKEGLERCIWRVQFKHEKHNSLSTNSVVHVRSNEAPIMSVRRIQQIARRTAGFLFCPTSSMIATEERLVLPLHFICQPCQVSAIDCRSSMNDTKLFHKGMGQFYVPVLFVCFFIIRCKTLFRFPHPIFMLLSLSPCLHLFPMT